ncbi:MAG: NAD(P)-dependent oxidoreductase [Thalassovita sp.]
MGEHVRERRIDREVIGVAGCGRMGAPMLAALHAAGFDVRGYDVRDFDKFGDLSTLMLPRDAFADGLTTLISVVRDIDQTEDVLFGAQNFAGCPTLRRIIISSTLSPKYVRALRTRIPAHVILIDAPMSGAAIAAQERRLSFMLGGDPQDLDAAQPLFDAMGQHFHRMGVFGNGMQAKVLNNILAAANTALTRMVLDWADAADLDQDALLGLIHDSSGQNWFASHFDQIEFARDGLDAENSIAILVKDVESALDAAPPDADLTAPRAIQALLSQLEPRKT